ncbi:endogenous retrovirus group K member 7 Env polyprotein-like [Trachypithecus francoisi]|uniref:endogenous retrovirus group K member 7 Env polyprotein-like n=1 Tax=Trachypithecus francoisi TaxID=54180 RepID=UPI00141ADDD4|nr:endogenous retrovirus group K member 7 Env polyprotein-like [Trachypithecus francoisi]
MLRRRFWEDPEDPLVAAMWRLTLRRTPTVTSNASCQTATTSGQIKKPSQMAEETLRKAGQPVPMSDLMVAVVAVITTAVSVLPPGLTQGTVVLIGHIYPSWLAVVPGRNHSMTQLHMLSKSPVIGAYHPQKPICKQDWTRSEKMNVLIWEDCFAEQAEALHSDSYGIIIDQSPKGMCGLNFPSRSACRGHTMFSWSEQNSQVVEMVRNTARAPIIWNHSDVVAPQPPMIWPTVGAKHKDLWKLLIAFNKIRIGERIEKHLEGHSTNLSLDVAKLKAQIVEASHAHLTLMPGTGVLEGAADRLAASNPLKWIKTLGGSVISVLIVLFICAVVLFICAVCIVCSCRS